MDLCALTLRDTYRHPILHPITKAPVPHADDGDAQWIELYGADTKHYRNALAEVSRLGLDDPTEKLVQFLARITARWHIEVEGKTPAIEDAAEVYDKLPEWLRDDVFAAAVDRANFFGAASPG